MGSGGGQGGGGSQISAYMNQGVPIQTSGFSGGVTAPSGVVGGAPQGVDLYGNMLSTLHQLFGSNVPWNFYGVNNPVQQADRMNFPQLQHQGGMG